MKNRIFVIVMMLLGLMTVNRLGAQMSGNPIDARGTGQWTLSATGTYFNQHLSDETISKRILAKSSWGIASWLDLYCLGGAAQVQINKSSAKYTNYTSKYSFAYGAGLNMVLKSQSLPGIWLMAGAQVLRFPSEGSFKEYLSVGSSYYEKEYGMTYDWQEVKGNIGLIFPMRSFRLYLAATGWLLQRYDTKTEYLDDGNHKTFVGEEKGEYCTGLWTGGIIGLEILLPQRYSLSVEALFFNEYDYQVMIGICQTGGFRW